MQKKTAGKWYMDGWIKQAKKERKYYLLMRRKQQSVQWAMQRIKT